MSEEPSAAQSIRISLEGVLTPQQFTSVRDRFNTTKDRGAFGAYFDTRYTSQNDIAAVWQSKFEGGLQEIVAEVTGMGSLPMQPIIDALYYDTIERLARGMDPIPVVPTDVEEAFSYFSRGLTLGEGERSFRQHLKSVIEGFMTNAEVGDEVWRYKSRYIGALAGHEGIALVRGGNLVKHQTIITY